MYLDSFLNLGSIHHHINVLSVSPLNLQIDDLHLRVASIGVHMCPYL